MNNSEWRQKFYGPYADFWKVLKIIKDAQKHCEDPAKEDENDAVWKQYIKESESYVKKYKGNPFAEDLSKFFIKYDDVIAKINQEAANEMRT